MKTRTILSGFMLLPLFCAIAIPAWAQAAYPQDTLNQYVAGLQNNPNDTALRGKIIALAQTMSSPAAIPEEARRHYVMATTFAEKAKSDTEKAKDDSGLKQAAAEFANAIQEYKAALLAAPWWADAYKKLAIAQKAADQYDDAIASLNLYLLTQPADARDAQDEIYKLEADKQAAAQATAQAALEEQQRRQREEENSPKRKYANWLKGLDGARFVWSTPPQTITLEIRGNQVFYKCVVNSMVFNETMNIQGNTFYSHGFTYTISDDGTTITAVHPPDAIYPTSETTVYARQ